MNAARQTGRHQARRHLARTVASKEARKIHARQTEHHAIWFGLGMFGLVGWSVAIPTLIGVAIGIWIDARWPSRFSWTLMLLVLGVALGCLNAWRWIGRESHDPEEEGLVERTSEAVDPAERSDRAESNHGLPGDKP